MFLFLKTTSSVGNAHIVYRNLLGDPGYPFPNIYSKKKGLVRWETIFSRVYYGIGVVTFFFRLR